LQAYIKHEADAAHLGMLSDLGIGEGGRRTGENGCKKKNPKGDCGYDPGSFHGRSPACFWVNAAIGPITGWSR